LPNDAQQRAALSDREAGPELVVVSKRFLHDPMAASLADHGEFCGTGVLPHDRVERTASELCTARSIGRDCATIADPFC